MGRVKESNLLVFKITVFAAILAIICTCPAVSADNLKVDPSAQGNYTSIQAAVDAAKADDTIFVSPGNYTENLKIDKQVRVWSDSRKPEDTVIRAADPTKSTVEISGDRVSFSGFGIEGSEKAQISLLGAKNCYINNNWVQRSEFGILLNNSQSNTISDNNVTLNKIGIRLENSDSNTILDNIIAYNYVFGISLEGSVTNVIYNNYFKNSENVEEKSLNAENLWQSPLVTRQNIIKGPYIGGNFWADLDGKGYSQTCVDGNSNGICDISYNLTGGGTDKFPLFPKFPNAVKTLDNKLNSTAIAYEQGLADEKNNTKVETPVNATNGTKKPSKEETPGLGLETAVLAALGAAYFLRRDR
jgi:parallel beta-helix repeat protein